MKILFVCRGNAYRSPLAEALLRKLRPDLEVDSAGVHVVIPIAREVRDYLKKQGVVQYLKGHPQSLDEKSLRDYDLIVAMDHKVKNAVLRECPDCTDKIVGWNIKDPYFEKKEDVERILIEIDNKVKRLAKSL